MSALVKICGITNQTDLDFCLEHGADFTGFVLHPASPRCADLQFVKSAIAHVTHATPVLVFGFDSAQYVLECAGHALAKNAMIQMPVSNPALTEVAEKLGIQKIIPVLHVAAPIASEKSDALSEYQYLLFDTAVVADGKTLAGGTGKQIPYDYLKSINRPFLLAGGLNPNNVCEAMRATRASGADVASGTEKSPGIKDPDKVKSFIEKVKFPEKYCS